MPAVKLAVVTPFMAAPMSAFKELCDEGEVSICSASLHNAISTGPGQWGQAPGYPINQSWCMLEPYRGVGTQVLVYHYFIYV